MTGGCPSTTTRPGISCPTTTATSLAIRSARSVSRPVTASSGRGCCFSWTRRSAMSAHRFAARALFDRAMADGWDGSGLVYTTDESGQPVVRDRFHWVVCEATRDVLRALGDNRRRVVRRPVATVVGARERRVHRPRARRVATRDRHRREPRSWHVDRQARRLPRGSGGAAAAAAVRRQLRRHAARPADSPEPLAPHANRGGHIQAAGLARHRARRPGRRRAPPTRHSASRRCTETFAHWADTSRSWISRSTEG